MRLRAENLLVKLGQHQEYLGQSIMPELTIAADTVVPSTPKRVEAIVNANVSAEQQRSPNDSASDVNTTKRSNKDSTGIEVQAVRSVSIADTTSHALPRRVRVDTALRQSSTKIDTVAVRPRPTATVERESVPILANDVLPTAVYDTSLVNDTVSFAQIADTLISDTLSLAENIPVKIFSMEGHKAGLQHPVKLDRSDGVFALLVISFLLLAHVYNGGLAFFKENITLVFSATKTESLETQTTSKETVYSFFLVFLAVLLISISVYEGLDRFYPLLEGDKRPFVTIGLFVLLILLFVVAKMMINRFIGYVFDFGKQVDAWNRSYLVLFSIFGLLCFLPTLMLVYSSYWHSIIIGFVLVLFLIVQIILLLKVIVFFIGQKFNLLYLIAYLCTIEILPYIFLGIGLVHLYNTDIF